MSTLQTTGTTSNTRIRDSRVVTLARLVWLAVFSLSLVVFILSIPYQFTSFQTQCIISTCAVPSLTPEMVHNLELTGIPVQLYASYWIVLESLVAVPFLITSLVLFWRRSDDRMAVFVSVWLASLPGAISLGVTEFAAGQPFWPLAESALWFIFMFFLILFLYLFPDARFIPRWTRWLSIFLFLFFVGIVVVPGTLLNPGATMLSTFIHSTTSTVITLVVIALFITTGVGCQIYRYRHVSTPSQRQQTKWVILGTAIALVGWTTLELLSFLLLQSGPSTLVYGLISLFAAASFMILMPLTIGFSAVHYRLWDVDLIVNRSLVYGALTLLLALGFIVDVIVFQHVVEGVTGGSDSPLVLGVYAVVVGVTFQPIRRTLQRAVDRHLFRLSIGLDQLDQPKVEITNSGALTGMQIGPYQMVEPIGKGGMGEVYKGIQVTLNRLVAIKILPDELAKTPEFRTRFEREARMVAALKHPNIVSIFDFGVAEDKYYMVMELIDGQALSEYIRTSGRLPLDEVRTLVKDIASALDYAHSPGLVHRDVKPSNIMLQKVADSENTPSSTSLSSRFRYPPYRPVLMDFGLAKMVGSSTEITRTGLMGTLDYIAPEQIMSAKEVDGRADLYSLGVVVYQLLTGELPFPADSAARLVFAHLQQPPPDPRGTVVDLPDSTAKAVLKALAKKPEDRFSTADRFAAALL